MAGRSGYNRRTVPARCKTRTCFSPGLVALIVAMLLAGWTPAAARAECFAAFREVALPADFVIIVPWNTDREVGLGDTYGASDLHQGKNECKKDNDHYAVDFALNEDDDVVAVALGEVDYAGPAGGTFPDGRVSTYEKFGTVVFIKHDKDFQTFYAHLKEDSLQVKQGDTVPAGKVLGKAGRSGGQDTNHLHFALYYQAKFQPYPAGPYEGLAVKPEPLRGERDYTDIPNLKGLKRGSAAPPGPGGAQPPGPGPGVPQPPLPNPFERWWKEGREAAEGWLKDKGEAVRREAERWVQDQQRRAERELQAWLERQSREVARQAERILRETCGAGLIVFPLLGFVALEWPRRKEHR